MPANPISAIAWLSGKELRGHRRGLRDHPDNGPQQFPPIRAPGYAEDSFAENIPVLMKG